MKKRIALIALALIFSVALVAACSDGPEERTEVEFWYLWGGEEAEVLEALIARFNESQEEYTVIGSSIPDVQRILVSISAGDGPDIAGNFSENVASYSDMGMIAPLDEYMTRDGFTFDDFAPGIVPAMQYGGQTMALPINLTTFMMYVNTDLLDAAGVSVPRTSEEMLDVAKKTTQVAADGSIEVLGYPDFPSVYFLDNMTFAKGGRFVDAAGNYTPDNPGTIAALTSFAAYRSEFGVDPILAFTSSARYMDTLADPFMTGHQALRIDGPWFSGALEEHAGFNYVAVPLPFPTANPGYEKGGKVSSSIFFIPSNANNKDGAWAFLNWLHQVPQMVEFCAGMGNIPSRISAWTNPAFSDQADFAAYTAYLSSPNLQPMPVTPTMTEFMGILADFAEMAMMLQMSPEEAMSAAAAEAANIR